MPDIWMDIDVAVQVPANIMPLIDPGDFKTVEVAIAYNEAGMNIVWNFVTTAGVMTTTAFTPTTSGVHDWLEEGTDEGMYSVEIPDTGGTVDNDAEGFGWISGVTDSCLPFRGPIIGFRAAAINNALVDGATLDVNINTIKTQTVTCAAGVTVRADVGAAAAPGAANGMFIGGTNAATTVASLSCTGQLDAGSVLVDAGMDVVGALSANSLLIDTTTTLTGNVSLGATLGVAGVTTFTGAVNANITGDITGNLSGSVGTCAAATVSAIGANVITDAACATDFDTLVNDEVAAALATYAPALASGVDVTHLHGSALTETVNGYLAAAFVKLFDVASPLLVASDVMRGTDGVSLVIPDAAGTAATPTEVADALASYGANTTTPPTAVAIRTEIDSNSTQLSAIVIDTGYIFDNACVADASSPAANSLAHAMRYAKWFAVSEWRIDESADPDTMVVYKADGTTAGYSFTVYTSSQITYRDPA